MYLLVVRRTLWALVLLSCADLAAQSDPDSTFHVSGTVRQFGSPIGGWVTFEGASKTSVLAVEGHYEANLPLGVWKVAVTTSSTSGMTEGSRLSHPRVFRVMEPMNVTIDLYVNHSACSVGIATPDGRPPTTGEVEAVHEGCQGRILFPLPSDDGVPFEVVIGGREHDLCSLGHKNRAACEREFGTFNLLTVYADKVSFTRFPRGGLLEAKGDAVVKDGSREYRKDSVKFLINNGQAVEAY